MKYAKLRKQMVDVCRRMWTLGWVAANDGNLSVKIKDDLYMCTPTGVSKSYITPDMLLLINGKGEIIEGKGKPSSEIKMHLRCYKERDDVGAVMHAHPPVATGFACAHVPLDSYSMIETVIAIGSVPIAPYGTPSTDEVPDGIAPLLPEHDVILLENHGALTVGSDLTTAYYRMETLELYAQIMLTANQLGGAKEISKENIDRLISMRSQYKVTGRHPGYKKFS